MANAASGGKWPAKRGAEFYCALCVVLHVVPRTRQMSGKTDVDEEALSKIRVETVEKLVVIIGCHSRVEAVQNGVLEIALGVPSGFDWLAPCNSAAKIGMGVFDKPWPEMVEPRSSLDPVESRVNRKKAVLERKGTIPLLRYAWCV